MKAIPAIFAGGQVMLTEPAPDVNGVPVEVLVIFPDSEVDPWDRILNEATMRPSFKKFMDECLEEIAQGKAEPLDLDKL